MSSLPTNSCIHPACLPLPPSQATLNPPTTTLRPPDYSITHPAAAVPPQFGEVEPTSPSVSMRWQEQSMSVSHAASTAPDTPLSSYSSSPVQSVPASPTLTAQQAALIPNMPHASAAM